MGLKTTWVTKTSSRLQFLAWTEQGHDLFYHHNCMGATVQKGKKRKRQGSRGRPGPWQGAGAEPC